MKVFSIFIKDNFLIAVIMIQTISPSEYLTIEVPRILSQLKTSDTPKWGIMTAQHMVEHLTNTVRMSNGKRPMSLAISLEQMETRRTFMLGENPFPKNVKTVAGPATLFELRQSSLESAKEALLGEIQDFFTYFEGHDGLKPIHPAFGELSKKEWLHLHKKHFIHHFNQFGLLQD